MKHWPRLAAIAVAVVVIAAVAWWRLSAQQARLIAETRSAIAARRGDVAVGLARRIVAHAPESIEGWALLARAGAVARDRQVWETAIETLQRLSPADAAALCVAVGGEEMQQFRAASAEQALRGAIAISPDRPEPWRLLAQLLSVQWRPRETAECLLNLVRLGDFTSIDLQTLAYPNSATAEPKTVDALLAADPGNLVPMLGHVGAALDHNRTAQAERMLKTIIERHPDNGRAIGLLGRLLAERDAAEFLQWQREMSVHSEQEPECWIARGIWLRRHGQVSAAARCFYRAVELDPRHLNAASELGHSLQAVGESSLAAAFLDWARLQQEITELSRRISELGQPENLRKIVGRLEQAGRLWEAWGWCRLYVNAYPGDAAAAADLARLKDLLQPDLPRTVADAVPGRGFDRSLLAEPDWTRAASATTGAGPEATSSVLQFEDDAQSLGIEFHYENGPARGGTIAQTSGGGVAAFDYDRDGWCDLYFTQGGLDPAAPAQTVYDRLFRNRSGQRFEQVTAAAGIHEDRFSQGVAAGDIDNDGFPDLYVANLGQNRLLRNNGDGTFTDVTSESGLAATGWTTSTAIADLNGDGSPELFSVRYCGGPEITTRVCRDATGRIGICRPTLFPAEPDLAAVSAGDGQFTELCHEAGLDLPDGRGFGLIVGHFNGDRRLDVFVANDQTANDLLLQDETAGEQLRFVEQAVVSGVAFDRDGYPQACMGIAAGDLNDDGRPDMFITNFEDESDTLYMSQPHGGYVDWTREAGLRGPGFPPLGFGTQFLDADLDGRLDLVVLNGHIHDGTDIGKPPAIRPQLYRGLAGGRFVEVVPDNPRSLFHSPRVGRGLCVLDWNRDGKPDFAGSFLDGNAVLATDRTLGAGQSLVLEFAGVQSSRDAIGTRVRLEFDDGSQRLWQLTAGDGFAASNQRRLHLGLGALTHVAAVEINWPSGQTQRFHNVRAGTVWLAIEGQSQLRALPSGTESVD